MPTAVYDSQQIRIFEQKAYQQLAISEYDLMQTAGLAAFTYLQKKIQPGSRFLVCCGGGNNGGDGLVVARLAHEAGFSVQVLLLAEAENLAATAKQAYQAACAANVAIFTDSKMVDFANAAIIVDALLGIGLQGDVRHNYQQVILAINQSPAWTFALDVPSGICANTGCVLACAVQANATMTFIALKSGLLTGASLDFVGDLLLDDLNLPGTIFADQTPLAWQLNDKCRQTHLGKRLRNTNKGDFGHVLIIGGDEGMAGAVIMSAQAALRVGAGLVSIATRPEHVSICVTRQAEIMAHGVEHAEELNPLLAKATLIVLGPGLGQQRWGEQLWQLAMQSTLPKIIDADGLNWLAKCPGQPIAATLTPHPGEAARLLHCSTQDILQDRYQALAKLQQQYASNIVLKGAGSLIAVKQKNYICSAGNSGMASGGMGDVLSGILGGLMAQKIVEQDAVPLGVYLHAYAADLVAQKQGERGMLATDLLDFLPRIVNIINSSD